MSDPTDPILVAFGRCEVAIRSEDPEVHATLQRDHRHMPGLGTRTPDVALTIRREGARFVCTDSLGASEVRETARWAVRWARHRVLEAMVEAHPELLWLHGAAVGIASRGLLIIGPRGSGKSTLSTALYARGASYLSDDVLPIDPQAFTVRPFPRTPEVRIDPGEQMPPEWLLEVDKEEIEVHDRLERAALPIRGLIFPRAGRAGGTVITPCAPSEAVIGIAECSWNFADDGARAAATISRLASTVPVVRVAFDDGVTAAQRVIDWLK